MPDVQAPHNDDAAHSNLPASNPDQVEQISHGRRSSEQVTTEQNATSSATEPLAEVRREGENPSVNGHASGEDQGEQQPAQTVLQSSSAGAQEKSLPSASTVNPSIEKPVDDSSTHAVSVSKSKSTTSMPAAKLRTSRQKKPSIFSRLFKALVPCVGPSKAHDVDADNASATALREKQPDEEKKEKAPEASSTSIGHGHSPEPSSATLTTLPNAPAIVPSQYVPSVPPAESNDDAVVIVPPSPSKRLPTDETGGVTSAAVQPPGSTGTEDHEVDHGTDHSDGDQSSFRTEDDDGHDRAEIGAGMQDDEDYDEEERLIMNGGAGIPIGPDGLPRPLLPEVAPQHIGRKCLVLDLDETLVHSSFKLIPQADYVVPVEIEWQWHNVYVIKRPGVDNFLKQMGELYEVVVFTASLSKYADPVLDKLDVHKVVSHRLFRESCYNHKGNYVKDLSQLGRPASSMIILDNSPASYIFHPNNAVPVSSWFNDPHDTELTDLVPFLADLRLTDDVRGVLDGGL